MTETPVGPKPLRVLVADDEPLILRGIRRVLEERGHSVHLAQDAHEAEELARAQEFDVLLLDVGMPGDGVRVARVLRDRPGFEARIILMTGALAADTGLQMGSTVERLQKPFRLSEVAPILEGRLPVDEEARAATEGELRSGNSASRASRSTTSRGVS